MKTVSARDANQSFSKLLAEVEAGREVIITRRGEAVARMVPIIDRCKVRSVRPRSSA
jgi:prevent-host-death family protein